MVYLFSILFLLRLSVSEKVCDHRCPAECNEYSGDHNNKESHGLCIYYGSCLDPFYGKGNHFGCISEGIKRCPHASLNKKEGVKGVHSSKTEILQKGVDNGYSWVFSKISKLDGIQGGIKFFEYTGNNHGNIADQFPYDNVNKTEVEPVNGGVYIVYKEETDISGYIERIHEMFCRLRVVAILLKTENIDDFLQNTENIDVFDYFILVKGNNDDEFPSSLAKLQNAIDNVDESYSLPSILIKFSNQNKIEEFYDNRHIAGNLIGNYAG